MSRHLALTVPAPLVLTLSATNIIATSILLNRYIASRASLELNSWTPSFKGICLSLITSSTLMPGVEGTLKAGVFLALWANHSLCLRVTHCYHWVMAVWIRTILLQSISLHFYIPLKIKILVECFLVHQANQYFLIYNLLAVFVWTF